MPRPAGRRSPDPLPSRPIDAPRLQALAIAYVGRYATTRAKLGQYLRRKLAQAGWGGEGPPPVDEVVARCAELGYVDDAAFAATRGAALTRRGYGERRVAQSLAIAGIDPDASAGPRAAAADARWEAGLAFARRRRIGPFADAARPPEQRRKDVAALMRAGHRLDVARRIAEARPGESPDET